jgi:hypothetical protein
MYWPAGVRTVAPAMELMSIKRRVVSARRLSRQAGQPQLKMASSRLSPSTRERPGGSAPGAAAR